MLIPLFLHRNGHSSGPTESERLDFVSKAIDVSVDAIAFTDTEGRITFANRAFVHLWGYQRPADVGGRFLSGFVTAANGLAPMDVRSNWSGEALGVAASGMPFPIAGSITRIDDAASRPVGFAASFRDIGDRARAERALRDSEERFRVLVDAARDTIFTADVDGHFLYGNEAAATALGLPRDQVQDRSVDDLFPPQIAEEYRAGVQKVFDTGATLTTEDRSEVDGHPRWFSTVLQPMRNGDGEIVAAQGIVRDITSRKVAEERLRQSEERLNQAIAVADLGIFDHDHTTDACYWSAELRRIIGWEAEAPPAPPGDRENSGDSLIHPDDRERIRSAVVRAHDPRSDGFYDVEYQCLRPDGEARWVKVRSRTLFQGEGAMRRKVRTVGAVQDITAEKAAEADRSRLREQLTQAQKMESVGRLAGGIAHDFNNMLSVISGHVELALRATDTGDPVRADLEHIRTAARRVADLTRQLLGFARRQVVAPRVLDLNRAVAGSLTMLRRLIGEDIELMWIPGQLGGYVRIDPHQIDQVLANLAANACDAISGVGRLTIETGAVDLRDGRGGLPHGPYTVLRVSDTGCGMDEKTAAHVFEPFFTTKPVGRGTGLGLATVYGIVKQNSGCVEVDTGLNRGTSVRIFLPSVEAEVSETSAEPQSGTPRSGHETVLLVEDESAVLRLSKLVLERFGYEVLTAGSPGEAIEVFGARQGRVHLLVTDVVMPEMNGRELAARLRTARPDLRTLFVSGYPATALAPRGVLEEGVHFLQKPFSVEDLAMSVRAALDAPRA